MRLCEHFCFPGASWKFLEILGLVYMVIFRFVFDIIIGNTLSCENIIIYLYHAHKVITFILYFIFLANISKK